MYKSVNKLKFFFITFNQLIILSSIFLTGRAGFITLLIGCIIVIISTILGNKKRNNLLFCNYIIINTIIITTIIFIILKTDLAWRIDYYFNFFKSFIFEQTLRGDSSTRGILDYHFVFILENFGNIIFGISDYTNTLMSRYASDLGFVCLLHGGGTFSVIAYLLLISYLIYFGIRNINKNTVTSLLIII